MNNVLDFTVINNKTGVALSYAINEMPVDSLNDCLNVLKNKLRSAIESNDTEHIEAASQQLFDFAEGLIETIRLQK